MQRFWIEFNLEGWPDYPAGTQLGCGVTAWNVDDAVAMVTNIVFVGLPPPDIRMIIADIDVSTLDAVNVLPRIGNVLKRGVWFPLGYAWQFGG